MYKDYPIESLRSHIPTGCIISLCLRNPDSLLTSKVVTDRETEEVSYVKLGMLIPEFPTQTHIFFWREIQVLREMGVEVHIVSTKRPNEPCPHDFARAAASETHYIFPPHKSAIAKGMLAPIDVGRSIAYITSLSGGLSHKTRALGYLLCAMDLADYARRHQLDHIHAHSCADAAHIVAMAHLLSDVPYSLHLHGDLPVYGKDHMQKMARAAFVAAAARPMQRQLTELASVAEENTYTMWMGVDTSRFQPSEKTRPDSALHLVSIGRLHLCKGHRYTFKAIRKLIDEGANIRYTVAGAGPHQKEIATSVMEENLGEHVSLIGSLGESQVRELLVSADAFVLSSIGLGEASPVAVMEAMAAGVPVVSSIIGGTPDMIDDGVDGLLVQQEDVDGLASAFRRLLEDSDFRRKLGVAARKRACEQFDVHVTSRKLLAAIDHSAG